MIRLSYASTTNNHDWTPEELLTLLTDKPRPATWLSQAEESC